jgi:hypothetical protein
VIQTKKLSAEDHLILRTPPGIVLAALNKAARPQDHEAAAKIFSRLLVVVTEVVKEGVEPISIDLAAEQLALVTVSANLILMKRIAKEAGSVH